MSPDVSLRVSGIVQVEVGQRLAFTQSLEELRLQAVVNVGVFEDQTFDAS